VHSAYVVERRGGKLSKPKLIAPRGAVAVTAALAGKTELVAWRRGGRVEARYRRGGAWSKVVRLGTGEGGRPSIAVTSGGRLLVAWRSSDFVCEEGDCGDGGTTDVDSAYGSARHGFRPATRLDSYRDPGDNSVLAGPVDAAFTTRGRPTVAWAGRGSGFYRVHLNSKDVSLSPDGANAALAALAAGPSVTVAWTDSTGRLMATTGDAAAEPLSATQVIGPFASGPGVDLAYPPGGTHPVALWRGLNGGIFTSTAR
jgi:hypothetical protein